MVAYGRLWSPVVAYGLLWSGSGSADYARWPVPACKVLWAMEDQGNRSGLWTVGKLR